HQSSPALRQDLRYSKTAANLDGLPTGHDNLSSGSKRRKAQEERAGVVIDRQTILCAGKVAQKLPKMVRTGSPVASREVKFEVRIGRGQAGHRRGRGRRNRCAP